MGRDQEIYHQHLQNTREETIIAKYLNFGWEGRVKCRISKVKD